MIVAIYDITTGQIKRFPTAPIQFIADQAQEGEEFFLNCPETATHIIDNEAVTLEPPSPSMDELKQEKRKRISEDFEQAMITGKVESSLGFTIDARRACTKNDLQNLERLVAFMESNSIPTATITDTYDVDHENITKVQVGILVNEISGYGLTLFAMKRQRIAALALASTKEEVDAV